MVFDGAVEALADPPDRRLSMLRSTKLLATAIAASALLAACGSSSSKSTASSAAQSQPAPTQSSSSSALVKTASNGTLKATVLVNAQGMTLYHLSGEQKGKFICTNSACLQVWHPLAVTAARTPTGSVALATVKRPDGSVQVTYKGEPLYTFAQDTAPGQANGEGIKDVGTWNAVVLEAGGATTTTPSGSEGSHSSGEGGGHGY
jgi:predicted lipoprotein with Yx(FWY)xxD motif